MYIISIEALEAYFILILYGLAEIRQFCVQVVVYKYRLSVREPAFTLPMQIVWFNLTEVKQFHGAETHTIH